MIKNELDELKQMKEDIIDEINDISNKLFTKGISGTDKATELNRRFRELRDELLKIEKRIFFVRVPDNSNGIIDLREKEQGKYNIYLSNTDIYVGFIEYNGYHKSRRTGDVGCKILNKYRGNNFAYYANELLGDLLYKKGIKDFWGTAFKDNIASRKLMEKYGGKLIADGEIPGVVLYECKTRPIVEDSVNSIVKGK